MNPVQALLACILEDPSLYLDKALAGGVTSDTIRRVDPNGVKVWDAILHLRAQDLVVNEVTVGKETGDYAYASGILFNAPDLNQVDTYITLITEEAARSKIADLPLLIQKATRDYPDPKEALGHIQQYLAEVDLSIHGMSGFEPSTELFLRLSEGLEDGSFDTVGTPTGVAALDRYLGGLFPGRFYILAGRPGLGKTSLALGIVRHQAVELGKRCAIVSLEMSNDELGLRLLSGETGIPETRIRRRRLSSAEWTSVASATKRLGQAPIYMDDRVSFDVTAMESRVRKMDRDIGGLDLLVIDYIQLMSARGRGNNRQEEVATISRSLKALAKTIQCPVLGLSQLSRENDTGRPKLSNLRESGALEQDADFVGMIYEEAGAKILLVPKNRFGEPGKEIHLTWSPETTTFS